MQFNESLLSLLSPKIDDALQTALGCSMPRLLSVIRHAPSFTRLFLSRPLKTSAWNRLSKLLRTSEPVAWDPVGLEG